MGSTSHLPPVAHLWHTCTGAHLYNVHLYRYTPVAQKSTQVSPSHMLERNQVHVGHSCKIGNMRPPGTLENQNPQFE